MMVDGDRNTCVGGDGGRIWISSDAANISHDWWAVSALGDVEDVDDKEERRRKWMETQQKCVRKYLLLKNSTVTQWPTARRSQFPISPEPFSVPGLLKVVWFPPTTTKTCTLGWFPSPWARHRLRSAPTVTSGRVKRTVPVSPCDIFFFLTSSSTVTMTPDKLDIKPFFTALTRGSDWLPPLQTDGEHVISNHTGKAGGHNISRQGCYIIWEKHWVCFKRKMGNGTQNRLNKS